MFYGNEIQIKDNICFRLKDTDEKAATPHMQGQRLVCVCNVDSSFLGCSVGSLFLDCGTSEFCDGEPMNIENTF